MPIERVFLGWDAPCLHQAAEYLRGRFASATAWDLSSVLIVTPARRTARRLLEVLAQSATTVNAAGPMPLVPPELVSVGDLPERLYVPPTSVADDLGSILIRIQSLRQAPGELLARIVPHPPTPDDFQGWVLLAQDLGCMLDDLAAQGLRCADVAPICSARFDFSDADRWGALADLDQGYDQAIARAGLQDRHAARLAAITDHRGACDREIILLATPDLNLITRRMLEQLSSPITALVQAPPDQADQFDSLGCLIVERWLDRHIELDASRVHIVDRPRDQVAEVLRLVRDPAPAITYPVDRITIGLGDESLAPMLVRGLDLAGVPARSAIGRALNQTRPATLLAALARFLASRRFEDLAILLRHPDLEAYLTPQLPPPPQGTWLSTLDQFRTDHLAVTAGTWWPNDPVAHAISRLTAAVTALAPVDHQNARALPRWSTPMAQVLSRVYGDRPLHRDHPDDLQLIRALEHIAAALRTQGVLPTSSDSFAPALTFAQAISFTLSRLADAAIPSEGGPPAVETLGWLELPLDDAPLLIITAVNEGRVPQSVTSDAFLPDQVRSALGLLDNRRRFARDVMALTAILASRPIVHLIAGRRGVDDDPLVPSRLLLARPGDELPAWIAALKIAPDRGTIPDFAAPLPTVTTTSRFYVPPPAPLAQALSTLRVTAFRDYLACPYRFYLRHILKLQALHDHQREMDAPTFGVLAHRVLQDFARGPLATATDARAIATALGAGLDSAIASRFGPRPPAAVVIQREQLRTRLADFAFWQARQALEGWRILPDKVERELSATLDVDGLPFTVTGRIDRIDMHPDKGYRILDYKTGDSARRPDQQHRCTVDGLPQWTDLQLPLYRTLAATVAISGPQVALGYVLLPKKSTEAGLAEAPWDQTELDSALEAAHTVIRNIRAGVFWPPAAEGDPDFAGICMDEALDRSAALALGVCLPVSETPEAQGVTAIRNSVLRASAGTGKTFALSSRYLSLLYRGAQPQTILATTFTRKAAGEILKRVLARLARAALNEKNTRELAEQLGESGLTLAPCRRMLADLCAGLHRVSISTIDSFFNRMAQSFRHELGIPPQPQVLGDDDPRAARLRLSAIDDLLGNETPPILLELIRRLHHDATQRSVTDSLDDLLAGLYDAYRQAPEPGLWNQLRVPDPLVDGDLASAVTALQDLASRASGSALAGALTGDADAAAGADWEGFLAKGLAAKIAAGDAPVFRKQPIPPEVIAVYQPLIGHAKSHILGRVARQTAATFELLRRLDERYTPLRRSQRVLLFSDLPHALSHTLPTLGGDLVQNVYYRLDARVAHLLLDEFQDTSVDQWHVLKPFASEIVAHGDPEQSGRSFFCVGDAKQAIYGWRGGCADIFERIERDLHLENHPGDTLVESFRSSQVVLDAVNTVFTGLHRNAALTSFGDIAERWSGGFRPQRAHFELPGYVELLTSPAQPDGDPGDPEGSDAEPDQENADLQPVAPSHAQYVAQQVARIAGAAPARSIGVLVATNATVNQMIFLLRRQGLFASGEGGTPLTDDPAVAAILAALTLADHPGDLIARFHISHSPLAPILHLDRAGPAHTAAAIRRSLLIDGYGPVLSTWARALTPSCDGRSVRRLAQLVELGERYDSDATLRPDDFVTYVRATPVEDPRPAPIRVMTIHKAKGLEFDIVVLPELTKLIGKVDSQSVFVVRADPTGPITAVYRAAGKSVCSLSPQLGDGYAQERSRRVQDDLGSLYVAMTRARYALHLIVPALKPTKTGRPGTRGLSNACPAAILRQALRPADLAETFDGGQVLFSCGDPAWSDHMTTRDHRSSPVPPGPAAAKATSSPALSSALFIGRSWRRVSPSSLESAGLVRVSDLLDLEPPAPRIRGSIVHAWFAQIEYLDPAAPAPDDGALRAAAMQAVTPGTPIDPDWLGDLIAHFQALLAHPARAMVESLSRPRPEDPGVTCELWRERPFAVRLGDRLLAGRFDRVMVHRRAGQPIRAELLDYKTDHLQPSGTGAAAEPYRPQMQAYRQALSVMLGLPAAQIETTLLFVTPGVRYVVADSDDPRP